MKLKIRIKYLLLLVIVITFAITNSVYAAGSFSVSANKTSLKPGENATVTVRTTNCAGKFSISSSNASVIAVSTSSVWIDGTSNITITAKANGTANIIVKPLDVTDSDLNDITGSKSVAISVKTPTTNATTQTTKPSTNTNTSNKPSSTSNKTSTTSKTSTPTKSLSTNAFLKEFRVDQPGITPTFNKTIYNYAITVGENVDKLNVTAVPEDNRATVNISGNTGLKIGDNTITVRVTAEDKKTVKTYKIIVTKTDDPIKTNAYLQNIIITNAALTPEFSSEVFDYYCGTVNADIEKLDITAFPVNEKAKVDITGNDKLETGENVIKIIVTSENSKTQKIYTIKVNKEERILIGNTEKTRNAPNSGIEETSSFIDTLSVMKEILKEKAAILLLYTFVWIEFLQVVYLYEKLKKSNNIVIK